MACCYGMALARALKPIKSGYQRTKKQMPPQSGSVKVFDSLKASQSCVKSGAREIINYVRRGIYFDAG